MATKNEIEETKKEILKNMGIQEFKEFQVLPDEEKKAFNKRKVDMNKSYFVKGSKENLRKFELCYKFSKAMYKKRLYNKEVLSLREYVLSISSALMNGELVDAFDKETLILSIHKQTSGVGNTENWMFTTALAAVAERNRYGMNTVILSERSIPEFEDSEEMEVIKLGGARKAVSTSQALNNAKQAMESSANQPENAQPDNSFSNVSGDI